MLFHPDFKFEATFSFHTGDFPELIELCQKFLEKISRLEGHDKCFVYRSNKAIYCREVTSTSIIQYFIIKSL